MFIDENNQVSATCQAHVSLKAGRKHELRPKLFLSTSAFQENNYNFKFTSHYGS
jgi:hypothetical protein